MNYTGNKHRLLEEIFKHIDGKVDTFVDLFSGGGSVGINVNAGNVYFIDKNQYVIGLLEFLFNSEFEDLFNKLCEIVDKYGLTNTYVNGYEQYRKLKNNKDNNGFKELNKEGFIKLRTDYNKLKNKKTTEAFTLLYVLMLYSFNNDIRFNGSNEFNLPCGKTDLNKANMDKLQNFLNRRYDKNFYFICGDFREENIKNLILTADVVYADPPYIITTAFYNENNGWNTRDESDLLQLLLERHQNSKKFLLSNVLKNDYKENTILSNWINDNDICYEELDYHYRGSSYNKKNRDSNDVEILVFGGVNSD